MSGQLYYWGGMVLPVGSYLNKGLISSSPLREGSKWRLNARSLPHGGSGRPPLQTQGAPTRQQTHVPHSGHCPRFGPGGQLELIEDGLTFNFKLIYLAKARRRGDHLQVTARSMAAQHAVLKGRAEPSTTDWRTAHWQDTLLKEPFRL